MRPHRPTASPARASRLVALAVDLDRTLLGPGARAIEVATRVLREARRAGVKVVLVSGREHAVLSDFCGKLRYVDAMVAENGAVVESPMGGHVRVVGRTTAARVRRALSRAPWARARFGEVVVSAPREMGPRLAPLLVGIPVTFVPNVDRVMILPRGVTKATGVRRAVRALALDGAEFAAIGDGENDLPLLRSASLAAAVANAHPRVLASVDYVCRSSFSAGVAEFVRGPLTTALRDPTPP